MRIKIVTSCTKTKRFPDVPGELTLTDFQTLGSKAFADRERELRRYQLAAGLMYTGRGHLLTMTGAQELRDAYGVNEVGVDIVSAGYGLLSESQVIVPYEATLNDMTAPEARKWAERIHLPSTVRQAVREADLVFVSLPATYLAVLGLPIQPREFQRIIYFGAPQVAEIPGVTILPTGRPQARLFGTVMIELKAHMIRALCRRMSRDRLLWYNIMDGASAETLMAAISEELLSPGPGGR